MQLQPAALRLLVVDDDDDFRESLMHLLARQKHRVAGACDLAGARIALAGRAFDAVLVDQQLGDGQGTQLLEDPCRPPGTEVVVITGHATVDAAVEALRRGAADYLTKPTDPVFLQGTLARLGSVRALRQEVVGQRRGPENGGTDVGGPLGAIQGRSAAIRAVHDLLRRVAPTSASVLLQGESGTGKELVAQAIHALSRRGRAPLVAVNCGAIPENLIESELFGHEKGSFTGAHRLHRGCFERAAGGTLFLDELTEMPLPLQVKLLRVLETGEVLRVGGSTPIRIDVRVLAATNRDPELAIRQGKLREDLYFRLAVLPITVPPLREREGDVELLARHFLEELNRTYGTRKRWEPGVLASLACREWRGNVRELRNWVQRAYILADEVLGTGEEDSVETVAGGRARPSRGSAGPSAEGGVASRDARGDAQLTIQVGSSISEMERAIIQATLEHVGGDKQAASRILGFSLKTLYNRLNVYASAAS